MIGAYDLTNIKNDIESILIHSQDYPFELDATNLVNQWYEAKKLFINLFGGKTIIRSPLPIKVKLSDGQRARRFSDFISILSDNEILTEELETFLWVNKDGFFDNKVILPFPSKHISAGTKLSKSFKHFFPDDNTIRWIQDTASRFIQENKIEGYLYLSVDPRDFLTLSENNEDWWSCHSLDGDYRAGNINYMVDETTIIAYLANERQEHLRVLPDDMTWNSKKWRMLIHTDKKNCIYYNRQYPYESDNLLTEVHSMLVPKLSENFTPPLQDCGFRAVECKSKSGRLMAHNQLHCGHRVYDSADIIDTNDYLGYSDLITSMTYTPIVALNARKRFQYFSCFKTKEEDEREFKGMFKIKIGKRAICPDCGEGYLERENSFLCPDCIAIRDADEDFYLSCRLCGRKFYSEDEIYWAEDEDSGEKVPQCKACYNAILESEKEI